MLGHKIIFIAESEKILYQKMRAMKNTGNLFKKLSNTKDHIHYHIYKKAAN